VPLNENFSSSQSYATPENVSLTDTSTGSDGTITSRRAFFVDANGNYVVPEGTNTDYIEWDYADATIEIEDLLPTKDMALSVTVQWLNVSNAIVYTKTTALGFTVYNENFDFTLSQMLSGNSPLMNDNGFFGKKSLLRTYIDSGNKAIEIASDITTAQICYDEATTIRNNSQYIFNINS